MKNLLSSQSIKLNKFTIFVNIYKYDTNREYYDISYVKNDENDKFDILDGEIIPKSHITIQLVKILLQESITHEDFAKIEKLSKYISNLSNERIYEIQNHAHDCCSKQQFKNSFEFILSSKVKNKRLKIMIGLSYLWA